MAAQADGSDDGWTENPAQACLMEKNIFQLIKVLLGFRKRPRCRRVTNLCHPQ